MKLQRTRYNDANRDVILLYIESGGNDEEIILSDKQKELLDRWRFADEKINEQKYKRNQIADFIIGKYGGSRDTAFRDIVNAQYVFSSGYPLNKQHMIGARIEFLQKKINDCYLQKDAHAAAKLEKELRLYILHYPDTTPPHSPKNIILSFSKNVFVTKSDMTFEDAILQSDEIIKQLEDKDDF